MGSFTQSSGDCKMHLRYENVRKTNVHKSKRAMHFACVQNPAQLLQLAAWAKFKEDISTVLSAFDVLPITVSATGLGSCMIHHSEAEHSCGVTKAASNSDVEMIDENSKSPVKRDAATSVKYLTSSKLFGLQVSSEYVNNH
jgi:hypothetical protein